MGVLLWGRGVGLGKLVAVILKSPISKPAHLSFYYLGNFVILPVYLCPHLHKIAMTVWETQ